MASTAQPDPIGVAFKLAAEDFRKELKNEAVYQQLLETTSIDEVVLAVDLLQQEENKRGRLRFLNRITPFLTCMQDYVGVIEVFMQVKPDILALIWGPIKLLLQWASVLTKSLDAILNTATMIREALPKFESMARLFAENKRVREVLVLFFKDILDFYVVALDFFSHSRWKFWFESIWPTKREKIILVRQHIEAHKELLRDEVHLEEIQRAHEARARALHFLETTTKELHRQEYDRVRTQISPKSFGSDLDYLKARLSDGTGRWLIQDSTFKKWIDPKHRSIKIFWLHGIPGAGKTFLSCKIVATAKVRAKTVYAFLSHRQTGEMRALAVFHSLIFQLASGNDLLQEIVRQADIEDLESTLQAAIDLFITLVKCLGLVYVVVDGLDEIDCTEIGRVIDSFFIVASGAEEVRILISSRSEDKIRKKLKYEASVRVDENNHENIVTFVATQSEKWLDQRKDDFSPEIVKEIQVLLEPLASLSKGMFLYASIVLKSIEILDEVEDIRKELRVLPERLDGLYSRVLSRINSLPSETARGKAMKILQWTACSIVRPTLQELEQALTVDPEDTEGRKQPTIPLDVVKYCGPIIEVVDNYVRFVHFTFEEYLLSPKIRGSISDLDAHLSLSLTCMTYLCQTHHDSNLDGFAMKKNILSGVYRLHKLASITWFEHVQKYFQNLSTGSPSPDLIQQLYALKRTRGKTSIEYDSSRLNLPSNPFLKKSHSDLCQWLQSVGQYRSTFHTNNLEEYSNANEQLAMRDPTSFSRTCSRLNAQINNLLPRDENGQHLHFDIIKQHYGARPYCCSIPDCHYYRDGFESNLLRSDHIRTHLRPWKCDYIECDLAEYGFMSREKLEQHKRLFHVSQQSQSHELLGLLGDDDILELLFDLIAANDVVGVQNLVEQKMHIIVLKFKDIIRSVFEENDNVGLHKKVIPDTVSHEMLSMILKWSRAFQNWSAPYLNLLCISACHNVNISAFRTLLKYKRGVYKGMHWISDDTLVAALRAKSEEFSIEISRIIDKGIFGEGQISTWLSHKVLSVTALEEKTSEVLISWLRALGMFHRAPPGRLHYGMLQVARYSGRVEMFKFLIECQAPLNWKTDTQHLDLFNFLTELGSSFAIESMIYLLKQGADPDKATVVDKRAVFEQSQKTWEEHIEETREVRCLRLKLDQFDYDYKIEHLFEHIAKTDDDWNEIRKELLKRYNREREKIESKPEN